MDASALIPALLPALNAATTADLVWWTSNDLYQWCDEAAKRLARNTGVFVVVASGSAGGLGGSAEVAITPAVTTVHASWNGTSSLRASAVKELEALDPAWLTTSAPQPSRWTQDLGLAQVRVYPIPLIAGTLEIVATSLPAAISSSAPQLAAPQAADAYFYDVVLGEARRRDGEAQMLDVAAHCEERAKFLEKVFTAYYGGGA